MLTLMAAAAPALAGSWTTGPVQDVTTPGLVESYATDPIPTGYDTELRLVYGLWNSPDVVLDVYFDGVLVFPVGEATSVVADPSVGYGSPGPGTAIYDVTALVTGAASVVEVVPAVPGGIDTGTATSVQYGEAVLASVTVVWDSDDDGDGFGGLTDCDDAEPDVYPGAPERCDLRDDDCDGVVDGPDPLDPVALFTDADGDGHGDALQPVIACAGTPGTAAVGDDCDDTRADTHPGAPEDCAAPDRDCDGSPDAGAVDAVAWTADVDGDGWGGPDDEVVACTAPPGHAPAGDCDDGAATVFPGADERCNQIDDDCDGDVDEDAVDAQPLFADGDGDGYGAGGVDACPGAPGTAALPGDCDDGDADVFPGADERCNGADDDCDGAVDEDAVDAVTAWADADGDGYGDPDAEALVCPGAPAWVGNADDCDDGAGDVFPGATERCDGADDDCDGAVDEDAVDALDLFADADGDGYGDPDRPVLQCSEDLAAPDPTDCDDADPDVYPGAPGYGPDCEPLVDKAGCGCDSGRAGGAWLLALAAALLSRRGRRRAPGPPAPPAPPS
ncbi:MAG: putative metal-binding motif-containing protein [Myxococcota bacterium]